MLPKRHLLYWLPRQDSRGPGWSEDLFPASLRPGFVLPQVRFSEEKFP
jgi:hypothetical protein